MSGLITVTWAEYHALLRLKEERAAWTADKAALLDQIADLQIARHPWYGPCDALADGKCAECAKGLAANGHNAPAYCAANQSILWQGVQAAGQFGSGMTAGGMSGASTRGWLILSASAMRRAPRSRNWP